MVANQAGLDSFLHMQQLCKEIACASVKHSKKSIVLNDLSQQVPSDKVIDNELMRGLYESKGFDQATQATGVPWGHGCVPGINEDGEDSIRPQLKRYDLDSMIYTDSSYQKDTNLPGASVYGWKDGAEVHIRIRPSSTGPIHTVNRAELIALLLALCQWQGRDDLVFDTDSAFTMKGINEHLQHIDTTSIRISFKPLYAPSNIPRSYT